MDRVPTDKVVDLSPFKKMIVTIGELPTAFVESMTYYEALAYFATYLEDKVIPAININATILDELQDYVIHYFDNLDVQEEINNKLDAMADSGELQEIIAEYINTRAVFGFDNISDMKSASNLIDGSYAHTCGKNTLNDGRDSLYKIREVTNQDVVDNENIIAMDNTDLIAEKIIHNEKVKKVIIIGDSYTNHHYDDITTFWYERFGNNLGLTLNSTMFVKGTDGGGFGSGTCLTDLQLFGNLPNKESVTDIFVVGGWNDSTVNEAQLSQGMVEFRNYALTTFPNARISVAFVGHSKPSVRQNTVNRTTKYTAIQRYIKYCGILGMRYITNAEYILHNYDSSYWQSDGLHPSQAGQTMLGDQLSLGFMTGCCNVINQASSFTTISADVTNCVSASFNNNQFSSGINNNLAYLYKYPGGAGLSCNIIADTTMTFDGINDYVMGKISGGFFEGTSTSDSVAVPVQVSQNGTIYNGSATIYFQYGILHARILVFNESNTNLTGKPSWVRFPSFKMVSDSLLC